MFGLGVQEFVVIIIILLILLGVVVWLVRR